MEKKTILLGAKSIVHYADGILSLLKFYQGDANNEDEVLQLQKIAHHTEVLKTETNAIIVAMNKSNGIDIPALLHTTRHDLRNHINSIIGYAEILIDDGLLKPDNLHSVIVNAKLIVQCINQLQTNVPTSKIILPVINAMPEEIQSQDLVEFRKDFSILIVDDLDENCQLLEKHLKRTGYETITIAHDAMQAKKILAEKNIDLVLLDIDMPVVSGMVLLDELKQDIAKLKLMVIMVTGSDTIENAIHCIKLGAEDFLMKPFNADMLRVRIEASFRKKWFFVKQRQYAEHLEFERKRYEDLLKAIFPPKIVTELSESGQVIARSYNHVALLFADVVGFTQYCDTHNLDETMQGIQDFSAICEAAASKYNLQKIKTIGDGFLAIAGMLTEHENPVYDCILTAVEILKNTKLAQNGWRVRAGIDVGTIIGGVVGHRQYLFDVWGDSVNTAARTQAVANPDRICLTARAWDTVKDKCEGHSLGATALKGKGVPMELFEFVRMKKDGA